MKKLKMQHISLYLVAIFFTCFLFLTSFNTGSLKGNVAKRQIDFSVKSRVPSVSILESSIKDAALHLVCKNDSTKTITAYSIASGGVISRTEYLDTSNEILAGSIFFEDIILPPTGHKGISILAVVYSDGTANGEPEFIKQILDARMGKHTQLQRILPIFQDSLIVAQGLDFKEKWRANVAKLQNLPEQEEGKSFEYNAALQDEKNLALIRAEQFEQLEQSRGEIAAQQMLVHLKIEYERQRAIWQASVNKQ